MSLSKSKYKATEISIRSVTDGDQAALDGFSCGNAELDSFLREDTIAREREGLLRTYLACDESTILGYASILADVLTLEPFEGDRAGIAQTRYPIPALKVARLGVAAHIQRGGGGTLLMNYALTRLYAVSDLAGCRFLVVDAKIETKAEGFYERLGFERNLAKKHVKNSKHAISMRFDPFVENAPRWVNDEGEVVV